jgi:low temperature requirement protein LtrA
VLKSGARGDVAQLGEHRVRIAGVRGSSPLISTTVPPRHPAGYAAVVLTAMRARDPHEPNRAATPLELLFDLTFVVAVAAVVPELAHAVVDGHPSEGVIGYLLVFFGIWWAWMNFTWFASAFDCDDALYRILTFVQMAGVLVLAAGVAPAFRDGDFATAVAGYALMRIALVAQWLRVAWSVPQYRDTALRFAIPIAAVQVLWILRLAVPAPVSLITFGVLVVVELLIPVWAEGRRTTPWHSHHIAERYGLFTIIVLGESVLASTAAILAARSETGTSLDLIVVAIAGLVLIFACWWLYFLDSDAPRLDARRDLGFIWGYGHFFVFASLAAIGAGIEVTIEAISHEVAASPALIGYSVAVPVAIFLVARYALYVRLGGERRVSRTFIAAEVAGVLAVPLASVALGPAWVLALVAAFAAGLVIVKTMRVHAVSAGEGTDEPAMSLDRHDGRHEVDQVQDRQGGTAGPPEGETERAGV